MDLYNTDPTEHLTTAGEQADNPDHDLCHLSGLAEV